MPCYPALALLLGSALTDERGKLWVRRGHTVLAIITTLAALAIFVLLGMSWNLPAPGDISQALAHRRFAYTLSLGHMGDLTIESFAYLRVPLMIAGIAFVMGARSAWRKSHVGVVIMMVLFFQAARLALIAFDPYMASRPLAEALNRAPHGKLILDNQYYAFSSIVFYAEAYHNERILLLNGLVNNLEYGSNAPNAPRGVFIGDAQFQQLWMSPERYYICVEKLREGRLDRLVGRERLHVLAEAGGKAVYSNQ